MPFRFDGEIVRVDDGISGGDEIAVSFMVNASGRYPFFLCPKCGRRVRFLYLPGFLCRECSRLNYRSQQTTKGSFEALAAIPEKMDVEMPSRDWLEEYTLPRPRYMRQSRYERYRKRFEKHQERFIGKESRIWGRYGIRGLKLLNEGWFGTMGFPD